MATTRPRHMITETDAIAAAIDLVIANSPEGMSRTDALRFIINEGIKALTLKSEMQARVRLRAVHAMTGTYSGMWDGFRREQLSEWPE